MRGIKYRESEEDNQPNREAAHHSTSHKSGLPRCPCFKPLLSFDLGRIQHAKETIAAFRWWQGLGQLLKSGHSAQNPCWGHFEC